MNIRTEGEKVVIQVDCPVTGRMHTKYFSVKQMDKLLGSLHKATEVAYRNECGMDVTDYHDVGVVTG